MEPKAVVYPAAVALLMAACDASMPTSTKQIAPPSKINPAAINYMSNDRDVPFGPITEPNPCNGDMITVTGNSHFKIMTGFDANGGLHYSANIVTKGQGVGLKLYKINEHFHYVENNPTPQDGFVIRQLGILKVDGPQTADDYYRVITFKTTVNANGEPTAEVEKTDVRCTP